ncbi:MAG: hypothetical protein CAK90_01205 [Spartobacteria bacterium AMD-G4]|nr:MAG: hypothetical protein CAK90_01205 [Spartobacteria bacterium AMD-G4]
MVDFAIAATVLRCQFEIRRLMTPLRCINICCRRSAANPQRHVGVEDFSAAWNATGNGMLPMADCMIALNPPSSRCALP